METDRGDAAAGTWIFRGRVAATPRLGRGCSVETDRGDAAAGTWIFRGDGSPATPRGEQGIAATTVRIYRKVAEPRGRGRRGLRGQRLERDHRRRVLVRCLEDEQARRRRRGVERPGELGRRDPRGLGRGPLEPRRRHQMRRADNRDRGAALRVRGARGGGGPRPRADVRAPRGCSSDESRRRRGHDVDIPCRGAAAAATWIFPVATRPRPRRGYSAEAIRGRGCDVEVRSRPAHALSGTCWSASPTCCWAG